MTNGSRSFAGRAALALALLVGFYALAFGIAGGLIAFMVTTVMDGHATGLLLPAALAVYAILRGVFFIERAETGPTGIRVDTRSEPQLMALVTQIADAMSTKVPTEVHLIPDVNAFVYEQGRFLGLLRTKRVMGIGLALLNVLRVDQLKAVLAHEYGHYVGGDTRLGGVIYRARASIGRTIEHLTSGLLRRVFLGYGKLFLRVTQRISRDQEMAADEAAVRIGGREAHASALRAAVGGGAAFDAFMEEFVVPLWRERRFPDNLYSGFSSFVADPERRRQISGYVEQVKDHEEGYGSHPSLDRRLTGIDASEVGAPPDPRPARDLLVHPDTSERQMSRIVSEKATSDAGMAAIPWDEAAEVLAIRARIAADELVSSLGSEGLEIEGDRLPRIILVLERADANKIVRRLLPLRDVPAGSLDDVVDEAIHYYVAAAMATDLIQRHGYRMELSWSKPFLLRAPNGTTIDVGERVGKALERGDLRSLLIRR